MKKLIIDCRMRTIEKEKLKSLGYGLIELEKSMDVYDEISAHPDIFCSVINFNKEAASPKKSIIIEPSKYVELACQVHNEINAIKGESSIESTYPKDIKYNICSIGKYVVHNFKYTDSKILDIISDNNLEKIHVNQGYTNCSIAVIDDRSIIIEDKGIYDNLKNYDLDILLIEKEDIVFPEESEKIGFIGGAISRVDDNIIITGDAKLLKSFEKIKEFIEKRNLNIIDFPGKEVMDYGGIIEI